MRIPRLSVLALACGALTLSACADEVTSPPGAVSYTHLTLPTILLV